MGGRTIHEGRTNEVARRELSTGFYGTFGLKFLIRIPSKPLIVFSKHSTLRPTIPLGDQIYKYILCVCAYFQQDNFAFPDVIKNKGFHETQMINITQKIRTFYRR